MSDFANENVGDPVKFEFQRNNGQFFNISGSIHSPESTCVLVAVPCGHPVPPGGCLLTGIPSLKLMTGPGNQRGSSGNPCLLYPLPPRVKTFFFLGRRLGVAQGSLLLEDGEVRQ